MSDNDMTQHADAYAPADVYAPANASALDCPIRRAAKAWGILSADRGSTQDVLKAAQREHREAKGDAAWRPPRRYKWCASAGGWCRE